MQPYSAIFFHGEKVKSFISVHEPGNGSVPKTRGIFISKQGSWDG